MNSKNKKVCTTLNYLKDFLTSVFFLFTVTGCISISAFASLLNVSTGIMISTIESNICAIIVRIKSISQ